MENGEKSIDSPNHCLFNGRKIWTADASYVEIRIVVRLKDVTVSDDLTHLAPAKRKLRQLI